MVAVVVIVEVVSRAQARCQTVECQVRAEAVCWAPSTRACSASNQAHAVGASGVGQRVGVERAATGSIRLNIVGSLPAA